MRVRYGGHTGCESGASEKVKYPQKIRETSNGFWVWEVQVCGFLCGGVSLERILVGF